MVADAAACLVAFLHMSMSIYHIADAVPGESVFNIHLGPKHWLCNAGFIAVIYQICTLLLMLAMVEHVSTPAEAAVAGGSGSDDSFYTRHRHALCFLNRLLRLYYSTTHMLLPGAATHFQKAIAARTQALQQRPTKALLLNVLHPTAFWMSQVRYFV